MVNTRGCALFCLRWVQDKEIAASVPAARSKMGTAQEHQLLCTRGSLQNGHSVGIIRVCAPNMSTVGVRLVYGSLTQ